MAAAVAAPTVGVVVIQYEAVPNAKCIKNEVPHKTLADTHMNRVTIET